MSAPVDKVQALLATLRRDFLDGLPERCDGLEQLILGVGNDAGDAVNQLFRDAHSLKGAGGTFGLGIVSAVCHHLESLIAQATQCNRFDEGFVGGALACVDLLRDVCAAAGQEPADFGAVERALAALQEAAAPAARYALVAETSAVMVRIYRQVLAGLPLHATFTDNGLDALQRLIREPYAIAIMGGELPELNGTAVIAALRASRSPRRDLPVVLVSSSREPTPAGGTTITIARDESLPQHLHDAITALLQAVHPGDGLASNR